MKRRHGTTNDHLFKRSASRTGKAEAIAAAKERSAQLTAAPVATKRGRKPDPNSLSMQAARWADANNASYKTASEQFDITPQAVQLAWSKLHPGERRWHRCGRGEP